MLETRSNPLSHRLTAPLNAKAAPLAVAQKSASFFAPRRSIASRAASDRSTAELGGINSWLKRNIYDRGLRSAAVSAVADGGLDRSDMISLFQNAKDGKKVDQTEFKDLQKLVNNGDRFAMPDYVKVLSKKIAFGNAANREYQGKKLGNLRADSSAAQLQKLVNKWFLGTDRPLAQSSGGFTQYEYRQSDAPLFQDGISYSDIKQGDVGDCYFVASLSATALQSPQQIQNMFIDNGDGTFTVRFYKDNGAADYVTVDRALPEEPWSAGTSAYADHSSELWVGLAEKAYVQINESGSIKAYYGDDQNANSYQDISSGNPTYATWQISGRSTDWGAIRNATAGEVQTAFNSGKLITFDSTRNPASLAVEQKHAYVMVGYDAPTQTFTLYNPWGIDGTTSQDSNPDDGRITLTWTQLTSNFDYWNFTL